MTTFTKAAITECFNCGNGVYKDGYCKSHWEFLFADMTNHERMVAKAKLREAREANK